MIHFNDYEAGELRAQSKALSLKEEMEIVEILRNRIIDPEERAKIQRLVTRYEVCRHSHAVHGGS